MIFPSSVIHYLFNKYHFINKLLFIVVMVMTSSWLCDSLEKDFTHTQKNDKCGQVFVLILMKS